MCDIFFKWVIDFGNNNLYHHMSWCMDGKTLGCGQGGEGLNVI